MTTFILKPDTARQRMAAAWQFACTILQHAGKAVRVVVEECQPTRTLEQNSKMWAVLTDISKQLQWDVDGELVWLDPEDWKDLLTAGLKKHQRVARGILGGFVLLGVRTKKMKISQMSELIEFGHWFGAERGVVFGGESAPAQLRRAA